MCLLIHGHVASDEFFLLLMIKMMMIPLQSPLLSFLPSDSVARARAHTFPKNDLRRASQKQQNNPTFHGRHEKHPRIETF